MSEPTVKAFKMISGEEVVAKVTHENTENYYVTKPLVLMATPQANGQMSIAMVPWMMTADADSELAIAKSAVGAVMSPSKQFADGYLQQTTNIALGA